jgi:indolepyruvate decarboxylase
MSSDAYTIGQYLVDRLHELEVRHLFAVPGPHCSNWLHHYVEKSSSIQRFGVAKAANAGYAADGYARINGLGAVCVSYSVGAFGLLNSIAGAFVERVPVVVINGAPPAENPSSTGPKRPFVGDSNSNLRVYSNVTCATERLTTPEQAPHQIDAALQASLRHSRPVYLEVSGGLYDRPCAPPSGPLPIPPEWPPPAKDADAPVETIKRHVYRADSTVVWGGAGLQRYGLEEDFDALVRALDVPYVTTLLGKGLLPEDHAHFAGVFDEPGSPSAVRALVRDAEYVLGLGVDASHDAPPPFLFDTGAATFVRSDETHTVPAPHPPHNGSSHTPVGLRGVLPRLRTETTEDPFSSCGATTASRTRRAVEAAQPSAPTAPDDEITYQGFYGFIEEYVGENTIIMSGTGLDRFGSRTLPVHAPSGFVCQAAYRDVGHVTPAAMGVDLASGGERVLVFVGDGGFQMTAQCVGTMAEKGLDPIIFVLNNGVYGSEQRRAHPATFDRDAPFFPQSILQQWHYRKLPDALGGKGWRTETYDQLKSAVDEAFRFTGGPLLIDVRVQEKSLPTLASRTSDSAEQALGIAAETVLPRSS